MPLQARVTLEMVHFDRRAVGGAPEGCALCLMCRCEHILNAKSSRDAFVVQRHEGHFCGCVMHHAWAGHLGFVYRSRWCILMGWPSVARPALLALALRAPYDCEKIPGRVFWRGQITCAELFCGRVQHGQAASGSCFDRYIAHFGRRAVRGAPGVERAV
jgi:hypothetical protein